MEGKKRSESQKLYEGMKVDKKKKKKHKKNDSKQKTQIKMVILI